MSQNAVVFVQIRSGHTEQSIITVHGCRKNVNIKAATRQHLPSFTENEGKGTKTLANKSRSRSSTLWLASKRLVR